MNLRYGLIISGLTAIGISFFTLNQTVGLNIYQSGSLATGLFALTISTIALALFSKGSMSLLFITRSSVFPIALVIALNSDNTNFIVVSLLCIAFHLSFFSEKLLSRIMEDISQSNENTFILKTPFSIKLWFTFSWIVFWATSIETIHLFGTDKTFVGVITAAVSILILGVFIAPQTRVFHRRVVIVTHGIVISDAITLTDVVLFPLAKISKIEVIPKLNESQINQENCFSSITELRKVVSISLAETTDALIVRNAVNESTRKNVDTVLLSLGDPKRFVSTFHKRFHKVEPQELTANQEKMIEKELGIQTAPRSDAKLPSHRSKKPKLDGDS